MRSTWPSTDSKSWQLFTGLDDGLKRLTRGLNIGVCIEHSFGQHGLDSVWKLVDLRVEHQEGAILRIVYIATIAVKPFTGWPDNSNPHLLAEPS